MRYVQPLTDEQRALLEQTMQEDPSFRARSRAHSLLLSAARHDHQDIAQTYQVHRVTVSAWIKKWEQHGAESLHDQPRSGRPCTLTAAEQALAQQYLKDEPVRSNGGRSLRPQDREAPQSLDAETFSQKGASSMETGAKVFKTLRDPDAFARCQRELEALQPKKTKASSISIILMKLALRLIPRFPMPGKSPERHRAACHAIGRINVLGFMNRNNDLHAYMFEESIHTGVVIACFDAFCHTITKKTVVVVDNASIHTSDDFADRSLTGRNED